MKALLSTKIGGADTLELREIPIPDPMPNAALVRVCAIGVNYRDCLIIEDKYQFKAKRPFAPCGEIAGIIEEIDENPLGLKSGDNIFADIGWGAMAQFVWVPIDKLYKIPAGLDFKNAAASIISYGTSLYALKNRANLKIGEKLLVLGAAGGVGISALQISKAMGARVIGAVSSEEKAKVALENGAEDVIIYPKGPFDNDGKKELKSLFKQYGGFDVIYDAIGGDYSEAALRAINFDGRFLVIGFPSGIAQMPLNLTLVKGCSIMGVFFSEFQKRHLHEYNENLQEIARLFEACAIKPLISGNYTLESGAMAIETLKNRQAIGKIVVEIK